MTLMVLETLAGAVLVLLFVQVLANLRAVAPLDRAGAPRRVPYVSVLIPARNEAARIADCIAGWTSQRYPRYEVVMFDDDSADDTTARAVAAARRPIDVMRGRGLPAGWCGKPHACHRLRQRARGEVLIFADADVTPAPSTVDRAVAALEGLGLDALSALPRHTSPSLAVRALVALQNWAAFTCLPAWFWVAGRPTVAAMNGQLVAIRADVYDASSGFAAVRDSLGEDAALGRRLASLGYCVRLLDGAMLLTSRPYRRLGELWEANVRNLVAVFFGSRALLLVAMAALAALYLAPWAILAAGLVLGRAGVAWRWLPLGAIALGFASRLVTDRRARYAWIVSALHPLAVAALIAMGAAAIARVSRCRPVEWRGRRYDVSRPAA